MGELNLIKIYASTLESCIKANKSESLMITVNNLYQLSQVYSINNENLQLASYFQTLALLCKKYLKTGQNIEKIQQSLDNFQDKLSSTFITSFIDKKTIVCLALNQCINVNQIKNEYENYNAYIWNNNNHIFLLETIDSPEIFSVEIIKDQVEIGYKFIIENLKIKVEDFNQTHVKLGNDNLSENFELNISIEAGESGIVFNLERENLWIEVVKGKVFKPLKNIYTIESGNYRIESVEKIFKANDDIFCIDRFC